MIFVWLGLAVPGLLWWREAVWFIVVMSLYANIAGEFAAYQAARSEESGVDKEDVDPIRRHLGTIHTNQLVIESKLDRLLRCGDE